jgi:hypothetical protein
MAACLLIRQIVRLGLALSREGVSSQVRASHTFMRGTQGRSRSGAFFICAPRDRNSFK